MPRKPRLFTEALHGILLPKPLCDLTRSTFHNQHRVLVMAETAVLRVGSRGLTLWDGRGDHHTAIRDAFPMTPGRMLVWRNGQDGWPIVEVLEDGTGVIVGAWRYDNKVHRLVVDVIPAGVE